MTGHPNRPGYQADYDPSDHRDPGHGTEFGADLFALYLAGRTLVPGVAEIFSTMSTAAHTHRGRVDYLAASVESPAAMRRAGEVLDNLSAALYRTCIALRDTGTALVHIADDFASTDQAACREFNRLTGLARDKLDGPTPHVTEPPSPVDPPPAYVPEDPPTLGGLLDHLWDGATGFIDDVVTPDAPAPTGDAR